MLPLRYPAPPVQRHEPLDDTLDPREVGRRTTLMAECRRLRTYREVGGDDSPDQVRILYRIDTPPEELGLLDIHGRNRWEGAYETFLEMVARRKWGMAEIASLRLADALHNWRWLFYNIADGRLVAEPALNGLLDSLSGEMDDAVAYA